MVQERHLVPDIFDREFETGLAFRFLPLFAHAVPLALAKCFDSKPWTRVQG